MLFHVCLKFEIIFLRHLDKICNKIKKCMQFYTSWGWLFEEGPKLKMYIHIYFIFILNQIMKSFSVAM